MNRRDFIKFMSITPAVAAASNTLVNTKHADQKIELLQPKKIMTQNDIYIFDSIISYRFIVNNNVHQSNIPIITMQQTEITAEVFINDNNKMPIAGYSKNRIPIRLDEYQYFGFSLPDLSDMKFIFSYLNINANNKEFLTANIQGIRIV